MTVLIKINRYLRRTGLSATQFGRRATNDPRLVHDLRHGRQPRAETVHRIEAFMIGHPDPLAEPSHAGGRGR